MKNLLIVLTIATLTVSTFCAQNVDNTTQGTSYSTIQAAIGAANPNDELQIAVANHTEPAQIVVDKNITLSGQGMTSTVLRPGVDTGTGSNDGGAFIVVNNGITFNLNNLTIDGTSKVVRYAIRYNGEGNVDSVKFTEIKSSDKYKGNAIDAVASGDINITNSEFSEIGRIGVRYFGTGISNSTFSGNTYTGKGSGDQLDYALDINAGANVNIINNTITNNLGQASDGSRSAGILVSTFSGSGTTASITDNAITDNDIGIISGFNTSDTSTVNANENDLSNNTISIASNSPLLDATCNWYGTEVATTIASSVFGNVDVSPYLVIDTAGSVNPFWDTTNTYSCTGNFQFIQDTTGDWDTASNWIDNLVPTVNNDATIDDSVTSTVTQNEEVSNLTLNPNSEVIIDDTFTLNVKGDITNNGNFVRGGTGNSNVDGEVVLDGTVGNQKLFGTGEYFNLRLNNSDGADVQSSTAINGYLIVDDGTFNTNDATTFPCDFSSPNNAVGQIGPVNGIISGDVTVEQCYPARRAFRFVSSSVTTTTTINDNWQEGLNNTGINFSTDNKPGTSGFGTHITGSITGANGFDATPSGNPSLFTFSNDNNQEWNAVGNTSSNTLAAGDAYRLMVRGDRTINVTLNATPPTDTKLRSIGQPSGTSKTYSPSINTGEYAFLGNPYHAVVDMDKVLTGSGFTGFFFVWDPTLGGTPTVGSPGGRGAYVTVNASAASASIPSGVSGTTQMRQFLQPYQGFFVQADQNNPSITFDQSDKTVKEDQVTVFNTSPLSYIRITMYDQVSYNNNDTADDGLVIYFSPDHTNAIDVNDAPKFFNLDETLARNESGNLISYENREMRQEDEILELYTSQYRTSNYVFQIEIGDFPDNSVYLQDNYTGTETLLDNNNLNTFNFSVDQSIAESVATDRFEIKFDNSTFSTNDFDQAGITIYPNPVQDVVNLNLSQFNEKAQQLNIFDVTGKLIDNYSLDNKDSFEIDMSNYASGLYILKIETESGILQHKLIKE